MLWMKINRSFTKMLTSKRILNVIGWIPGIERLKKDPEISESCMKRIVRPSEIDSGRKHLKEN